jgi:hypothetical protein
LRGEGIGGEVERKERTINMPWQGSYVFLITGFEILQKYKDECCCFSQISVRQFSCPGAKAVLK